MKKKNKLLSFLAFLSIFGCILTATTVNAETVSLSMEKSGYYWTATLTKDGKEHSWYHHLYNFDGRIAYCIEPGVAEGTDNYVIGDWSNTNYTSEQLQQAMLIAYYGYEYPNHQTLEYRAATQALIWEMFGKENVVFSTERWGAGTILDISTEKEEIMRLVNNHYTKPSFNGTTITLKAGESYTFTDTNGVLSNFEVVLSDNIDYQINGNSLTITPTKTGNLTISFKKKTYMSRQYLVYYGDSVQKMLSTGIVDPVVSSINIETKGGSIEFYKKDFDNLSYTGEATLENAIYGIYNANTDELIASVSTDSNGYVKYSNLPYVGDYYTKEITSSKGYQLDTNKYYFTSSLSQLNVNLENLYEHIIEREIEITKVYATDESKIMTPEVGVKFGFYDKNNNLVKTVETDTNGKATLNLVYGTYTVKQLTTNDGTEKVKDFTININQMGNKLYYTISNANIVARLKVTKVDSETGNTILKSGIKFKIYDVSKKEFVSQTITYPTAEKIDVFETDSNGILYTPYPLSSGKYILYEVDQIVDGYLWNSKGIEFSIDDNSKFTYDDDYGTLIEIKFENTQVKGEVKVNKYGEELVVDENGYHYEKNKLNGVIYELYAEDDIYSADGTKIFSADDLVGTYITEDGYFKISNLYLGNYYLIEKATIGNYVLDTEKHSFSLEYQDQYTPIITKEFNFENYLVKGQVEILKYGERVVLENNSFYYEDIKLNNVVYNLYAEYDIYSADGKILYNADDLIGTYTTNDGYIKITNLYIGDYYLVEDSTEENHILDTEKYSFSIKYTDEYTPIISIELIFKNYLKKGTLDFTKTDISTGEVLPNTKIQIYDANSDTLIFEGITDEQGKIIINNLYTSKFYILESEAPDGYLLNPNKMEFEIKENGEIVKATMVDEIIIEVPNTEQNQFPFYELFSLLIITFGMGAIVYVKNNKRK